MIKCICVLLFFAAVAAQAPFHLLPLDRALPPRADAIYQQLATSVDPAVAMDTARMMAPLWRLAGNQGSRISDLRFQISDQFEIFDLRSEIDLQSTI